MTKLLPKLILLFFLAILGIPLLSQVQIIGSSADAYIRGGTYSDISFGNETDLFVKQGNVPDFFRKIYLKFNLSAVDFNVLDSAILRLYANYLSDTMKVNVLECTDNWDESSITWNSAPDPGRTFAEFEVNESGRYYEMDVTSYVLNEMMNDTIITFVLYDMTAFNQQVKFNSKEAAGDRPELKVIPGSGSYPASPDNLVVSTIDTGSVLLNWTDRSHNEMVFVIERKSEGVEFDSIAAAGYNITSYLDSNLQAGKSYTYRIYATGTYGNSEFSNESEGHTESIPSGPPFPPTGLSGVAVSTVQINLQWTDNSQDEKCFILERKQESGTFAIIDTLGENVITYIDFGLMPATSYTYRVYSSNLSFDSNPSNEFIITTSEKGLTYYIDDIHGDDSYEGTSPGQAWKTLDRVNAKIFSPGDSILFAADGVWTGQLWPKGSGTSESPIVIDRFGNGNKPLIDGGGIQDKGVVYLYNQSGWEINNLEIINDTVSEGMRRGVEISGEEIGVITHIHLKNLHVHHIKGTIGDDTEIAKKTGGIFFMIWKNSAIPTRFDDILVEGCLIHDCANQGFVTYNSIIGYPGSDTWMPRRNTNMIIRNNTIHHITKNAMILRMLDGGLVEFNLCYSTATATTGNTIFTRSSRNVVCQYNEGYDNQSPGYDGSLYDADLESPGCIFQYSYSHDNAHGLYWQCTVQQDTGIIVRYNISQNDKGRIFYINYPSNGTHIYNNTVFTGEHRSPVILMESGSQSGTRSYTFRNNLIYNLSSSATYQWAASRYIKSRIIEHNLFYGYHPVGEPADPYKIVADPKLVDPGSATYGIESTEGYKLTSISPCIDNGIGIQDNGKFDLWENPLYNRTPDIGAHEYEGIPTVSTDHGYSIDLNESFSIDPNPLKVNCEISFYLQEEMYVTIGIYDTSGRRVNTLVNSILSQGDHAVIWNGTDSQDQLLGNGIYICNLELLRFQKRTTATRSIIIMR